MTPSLIVAVRCHYCSQPRNPREVLRMTGGAIMCWRCLEWHYSALRMLAGQPPLGCQNEKCGVTFAQLQERTGGGDIRMYVHQKDGVYQILCRTCSDDYVPKRVDLYGNTAFGHARKLIA